jgi:FMN reductase
MQERKAPLIVAIGGTPRPGSSTETALAYSLAAAEAAGARVMLFGSDLLSTLPMYDPWTTSPTPAQAAFVDAVREADGFIIASPAYHGSISGVVKNALDTLELTARDPSPYLHGKPVGTIITSYGWQSAGTSLMAMRAIIHSLRGWPTPMGATLNCAERPLKKETLAADEKHALALKTVAEQVVQFATGQAAGLGGIA